MFGAVFPLDLNLQEINCYVKSSGVNVWMGELPLRKSNAMVQCFHCSAPFCYRTLSIKSQLGQDVSFFFYVKLK
jgi:hypothetical protein